MRIAYRYAVVAGTFGVLLACTPGDEVLRPEVQAAPAPGAECPAPQDCPPAAQPAQPAKRMKPTVPPVPDSPLKVNCAKLPTQVERDTCTNRKLSTG
jgi:hypothetical protein